MRTAGVARPGSAWPGQPTPFQDVTAGKGPRFVRQDPQRVEMDFEIQRFTRVCAATGRELAPGEAFYSVLVAEGSEVKRLDYSVQGWPGPPEKCIGWWKSQVPSPHANKVLWAPNEVLLQFFEGLEGTDREDMRYVLALLLVRRRVLRLEQELRRVELTARRPVRRAVVE